MTLFHSGSYFQCSKTRRSSFLEIIGHDSATLVKGQPTKGHRQQTKTRINEFRFRKMSMALASCQFQRLSLYRRPFEWSHYWACVVYRTHAPRFPYRSMIYDSSPLPNVEIRSQLGIIVSGKYRFASKIIGRDLIQFKLNFTFDFQWSVQRTVHELLTFDRILISSDRNCREKKVSIGKTNIFKCKSFDILEETM